MKRYISIVALILLVALAFAGCSEEGKNDEVCTDYNQLSFVNISWTRDAENDTESIRFGEDGSFSYSCGCGNPVNDSDLCEGYTYDESTQTITLDCLEETEEMVTAIKVVKCTETELHLDFDGDVRVFTK